MRPIEGISSKLRNQINIYTLKRRNYPSWLLSNRNLFERPKQATSKRSFNNVWRSISGKCKVHWSWLWRRAGYTKGGTLEVEVRKARHAYSNAGGADVVIGIIKIRGLKLFRFMPALLFRCRAVTRSDSIPGNKFHALFRTRRNAPQSMEPILWKKSFLISRRVPIMHMHHPLTSSPLPLYIRSPAAPVPLSPLYPEWKPCFLPLNRTTVRTRTINRGGGDLSVSIPCECAPRTLSLEFRNLFSTSVFIIVGSDRFREPTVKPKCKSCWRSS